MTEFAERGAALIDNGYRITPIKPGTKLPRLENWTARTIDAQEHARLAANGAARDGVGILTGDVVALDVDVLDAQVGDEIAAIAVRELGATLVRTGRAPKRVLVYRVEGAAFPKRATAPWRDGAGRTHRVEVLGAGQQFVAFGTHPDTRRPYTWTGDDPTRVALADLPAITVDQVDAFLRECEIVFEWAGFTPANPAPAPGARTSPPVDDPFAGLPKTGIEVEDVRRVLERIDADDREVWFKVGAALQHQFGEDGRELWDEWSQTSHKFDPRDQERTWRGFKPARPGAPTASILSVFALAGVEVPRSSASAAPAAPGVVELRDALLSAREWLDLDIESPPAYVEPFLHAESITMLFARAGVGKTFAVMDLVRAIATGTRWMGAWETAHIPDVCCVLVDGEMPPYQLKKRLRLMFGDSPPPGLHVLSKQWFHKLGGRGFNITAEATRAALDELLDELAPQILILDNKSSLAFGVDENSNTEPEQVIEWLFRLRSRPMAIVMVHHAGKNGEQRGGSRFEDGMDSIIRLEVPKDAQAGDGVFVASFDKARHGKPTPPVAGVQLGPGMNGALALTGWRPDQDDLSALLESFDRDPGASNRARAKALDLSRQTVDRRVAAAFREGFLVEIGGAVSLSGKGREVLNQWPE
jgi:hypothetical protein